jgi:NTE family protein
MGDGIQVALALGGGGARAAYQAGVLRALARKVPNLRFPILTGVSAGAINTMFLASHTGPLRGTIDSLASTWVALRLSDVFRTSPWSLGSRMLRTMVQVTAGTPPGVDPIQGMVDTSPLRQFLNRVLDTADGSLAGVAANLKAGRIQAVAITTTRYNTAQSVTFCAGRPMQAWDQPQRISVMSDLTVDHVMASAALPLLFPAVRIGNDWYGDGGVRLVSPLGPAVHLGADRILAISTCYRRGGGLVEPRGAAGAPPPAQVMGVLYDAIFLDLLDQDVMHLQRINDLIGDLPPERRRGMREVRLHVIRPSVDINALANEYELQLPRAFRYLTRKLGTRRARTQGMLSTVMFEPGYLNRLIQLGERDGDAAAADVEQFLEAPAGT